MLQAADRLKLEEAGCHAIFEPDSLYYQGGALLQGPAAAGTYLLSFPTAAWRYLLSGATFMWCPFDSE
jgi:hypothetical protein